MTTNGESVTVYTYTGNGHETIPRTVIHVKVDSSVVEIADNAFDECRDLVTVQLIDEGKLAVIGEDAFSECTSLQYIHIPSTVQSIGQCCFFRCKSLVNVNLPAGLTIIDKVVFCGCYALQTINIPSTIEEIRDEAFLNCDSLVTINLPEGLTSIQEGAFNWCSSLRHIRIPSTAVEIGRCCFARCERLLSIELPEGLRTIGEQAFMECKSLLHIAIPSSTRNIGDDILDGCELLLCKMPGPMDPAGLLDAATGRFEDCPVHKLCYYHANDTTTLTSHLEQVRTEESDHVDDGFGMSPFHILALSKKLSLFLWHKLQEHYLVVDLLSREDFFGNTPLEYLCHKEDPEMIGLVTSLLHSAITKRVHSLGLHQWRDDIWSRLNVFLAHWKQEEPEDRMEHFRSTVRVPLETYEQKERLSLLELAVWNMVIENAKFGLLIEGRRARKKVKLHHSKPMNILDATDRENCRIHCGADIVIANVLPYLLAR
jgi:hypothetical protein